MVLDQELETFRRELPRMLAEHPGEYVLIRGDQVAGFWPDEDSAYDAGCDAFGLEPFLVKKVQAHEQPVTLYIDLTPECPS
jgi:hypothetical protein